MNHKVLKTKVIYKTQTGAMIARETGDILDEFGIRGKIAAITVDNASNMDVAVIGCLTHTHLILELKVCTQVAKWTAKIWNVILWMKK